MKNSEVSKDEFFKVVGPLDAVTRAIYRATSAGGIYTIFELRSRAELGRIYRDPNPRYVLSTH